MYPLRLVTSICPDGVGPGIRYRSSRPQRLVRECHNLADLLVLRFVGAINDEEKLFNFLNSFGLPSPTVQSRQSIVAEQYMLRGLLNQAASGDAEKAETVNNHMASFRWPIWPKPESGRLVWTTNDLPTFMYLEVALVATNRARLTKCKNCGKLIITGHYSTRRATAKFCGVNCQQRWWRQANKHRGK